ncbi:unnamed protein product, partial [Darwinula stevensoni]
TSGGRLHLCPGIGRISLVDTILIEDPMELANYDEEEADGSASSASSASSDGINPVSGGAMNVAKEYHNLDFKLIVETKLGQPFSVHLMAPSLQEKQAWVTDISQCLDNLHFNTLLHMAKSQASSVAMPQTLKTDPRLFKDDVDIRFSRALNSCKV